MRKVAEKRIEYKGRLREVEAEPGHLLIRLKNLLAKQARMDEALHGFIEQNSSALMVL